MVAPLTRDYFAALCVLADALLRRAAGAIGARRAALCLGPARPTPATPLVLVQPRDRRPAVLSAVKARGAVLSLRDFPPQPPRSLP